VRINAKCLRRAGGLTNCARSITLHSGRTETREGIKNLTAVFSAGKLDEADILSLSCGVDCRHEDIDHCAVLLKILSQVVWLDVIQQPPHKDFCFGERGKPSSTTAATTSATAAKGRAAWRTSCMLLGRYVFVLRLDVQVPPIKAVLHGHDALVERLVAVQDEPESTRSVPAMHMVDAVVSQARQKCRAAQKMGGIEREQRQEHHRADA